MNRIARCLLATSLALLMSAPALAQSAAPYVNKIANDIKEVLSVAETRQALSSQGAIPRSSTPAELQSPIDTDRRRYGRIIEERGIRAD